MLGRSPSDRLLSIDRLLFVLRAVVFLQCVGVAGRYWFAEFEVESNIYGLLFFDWSWPESVAQKIDDAGALACLFAGIVILLPSSFCPSIWVSRAEWMQRFAAAFTTTWMLALAVTQMIRGGVFAELSLGEHAVRFTAPLALMILLGIRNSENGVSNSREPVGHNRLWMSVLVVRIAASATFAVHGYKAFQLHGPFADLVLLSDLNWTNFQIEQTSVEQILRVIGFIDLLVAGLLWGPLMRTAAFYMVIWGMLTAASRITSLGFAAWPETLIRSANWGCPLFLVLASFVFTSSRRKLSKNDLL